MEAYGITSFCDDIRFEQNGKYSLIGCYGPDIIVPEFPAFLPKMGFLIQVRFPMIRLSAITLRIFLPGNVDDPPAIEQQLHPAEESDPVAPAKSTKSDLEPQRAAIFPFAVSPLPLQQAGHIRVRLVHGDQLIRVGTLVVRRKAAD